MSTLKCLKQIVTAFRDGIIDGKGSADKCLMVCAPLEGYLNLCGYECRMVEGRIGDSNHFWLVLPSGIIIDPTADQFKSPDGTTIPKVYIGERPKWYESP